MLWSNLKVFLFSSPYQKRRALFSDLHLRICLNSWRWNSSLRVPGFCSWMPVILCIFLCISSFGFSGLSCDLTSLIDLRRFVDFSVYLTFSLWAWSDGFQAIDKPDWILLTFLYYLLSVFVVSAFKFIISFLLLTLHLNCSSFPRFLWWKLWSLTWTFYWS